jgi:channel protein (hemolysin III family)
MKRTQAEEEANALTHFAWFILSLVSLIWSMLNGYDGLTLHSFGSLLAALGSTIYHKHDNEDHQGKQALRGMDKVCIFLFMGFAAVSFNFAQETDWVVSSFFVMLFSLILSVLYAMNVMKDASSENYYLILVISVIASSSHLIYGWHSNVEATVPFLLGLASYALGYHFYSKGDDSKWAHTAWHVMVMVGWAFHSVALLRLSS